MALDRSPASAIVLSLVSHTNAGKTTLARTLLGRDIGEVRDAPHVTEFVESHELLRSADGAALVLCDTPGFGDSARLARRMRSADNPLGWLLGALWDRWRDRAFWGSQQALRHVREQSDLVLYLVNAAESPAGAAYVAPEMELLGWIGRPVIVLLNQLGAPREAAAEAAERDAWRRTFAGLPLVRAVLPLDAFARCWVQEAVLLQAVHDALPAPRQPSMVVLQHEWAARRQATFDAAMQALARSLARIAATRIELDGGGRWRESLQRVGSAIGLARADEGAEARALAALQAAAEAEVRDGTEALLRLHGLDGRAQGEILQRVATQVALHARVDERQAALLGGVLTGALAGLKADLATGGLTLGGGMLAGALLGALGAAGLARGLNIVRGTERSWAEWPDAALESMVQAALLRYLAVAHFGRGRGQWSEGEAPAHWQALVQQAAGRRAAEWRAAWQPRGAEAEAIAARLQPLFESTVRELLDALYPAPTGRPAAKPVVKPAVDAPASAEAPRPAPRAPPAAGAESRP